MKRIQRGSALACLSVILIFGALPKHSQASNLTLYFNDPVVDSIEIITGQGSSPVAVGIFNDSIPDAPEDFLTGWQLSLVITPEAGATGTVTFASPEGPTATEPANYVLDGLNSGISVTNGGDTLLAFDFNFPPTGGVEVPTNPGSFLLLLELLASNDAEGEFGIYAVPGPAGTEWTDATPGIQQARTFANVPLSQTPVLIGSVRVQIPEPASISLLCFALLASIFLPSRERPFVVLGARSD